MLVNHIHSLSIFDLKLYQIYVAAFSIGMGPVPWVIMSEVCVIWFCGFCSATLMNNCAHGRY